MRDIPIFTAQNGIASLLLGEIPYRGEAYVLVRTVFGTLSGLLEECVSFCRAAGAKTVLGGGTGDFSAYPVFARLWELGIERSALPKPARQLSIHPVRRDSALRWAHCYNERFRHIPAAQTCTDFAALALPASGEACFLRDGDAEVGLGRIRGETLAAIASLRRGYGADIVCTLAAQINVQRLTLVCAEENTAAMRLYGQLGFLQDKVHQVWHNIFL